MFRLPLDIVHRLAEIAQTHQIFFLRRHPFHETILSTYDDLNRSRRSFGMVCMVRNALKLLQHWHLNTGHNCAWVFAKFSREYVEWQPGRRTFLFCEIYLKRPFEHESSGGRWYGQALAAAEVGICIVWWMWYVPEGRLIHCVFGGIVISRQHYLRPILVTKLPLRLPMSLLICHLRDRLLQPLDATSWLICRLARWI